MMDDDDLVQVLDDTGEQRGGGGWGIKEERYRLKSKHEIVPGPGVQSSDLNFWFVNNVLSNNDFLIQMVKRNG